MKFKSGGPKPKAPITTTIMELLYALSELTKDDKMVLTAFKGIFESYEVRLAHSLVPVQLVGETAANRTSSKKRR